MPYLKIFMHAFVKYLIYIFISTKNLLKLIYQNLKGKNIQWE